MSKISQYLQEHLMGEVTDSTEVRQHLAHDASVLRVVPAMAVYPRNEEDIRKTARFSWQLAERGRVLPITSRGGGSDTSGAAIGAGIVLLTKSHMHRVLALDPKKEFVTVEPGVTYDKLQQTLYTHGLFLPAYPASTSYATIGGGLANNAVGEKSVKYGNTAKYVQSLRVVLANGEVIETGPLSRRELDHKMGLSTLEGQIYRSLDALLEDNAQLIADYHATHKAPYSSMGYNLSAVKHGKNFDLTPLFIGSQGTLGIISEATLKVVPHHASTTLVMVSLNSLEDMADILPGVLALKPSVLDMINKAALDLTAKVNPALLANAHDNANAAVHLFVEFDDKEGGQKKAAKNLISLAEKYQGYCRVAEGLDEQEVLWKIRHSTASVLSRPLGPSHAIPLAEDACVPVENLVDFLQTIQKIYEQAGVPAAFWGQAGSGIVRLYPVLDLAQLGDRQKFFKLSQAIYAAAIKLGGSMSAGSGDGRVRAPYLRGALGEDIYNLVLATKKIFDPHGILNPGIKDTSIDDIKTLMRGEYSQAHRHEHLPKS